MPPTNYERLVSEAIERGDYATAERLCDEWDHATARRAAQLLPAALWYAEQGLRVFPLQPGGKQPMPGSRGFKDASTDPQVIREWWRRCPPANIGIATGGLFDVIDVDGSAGVISWARLDNLPQIYGVVSTPRPGGSHLYVTATPGQTNRAGIVPGIDVRAEGGYVVAPPSWSEQYGRAYSWRRPLIIPKAAAA